MPGIRFSLRIAAVASIVVACAASAYATPFDVTYYFSDTTPTTSSTGANNSIRVEIPSPPTDPGFDLAVSAIEVTQAQFASESLLFPGVSCLSYVAGGNCLEYIVLPNAQVASQTITITIAWLLDTNPVAQAPFILQAEHYDPFTKILAGNAYYPCGTVDVPTSPCVDPAVSGTTDNFSRFTVGYVNPVPEPATAVLVGSGILGVMARRRARRRNR